MSVALAQHGCKCAKKLGASPRTSPWRLHKRAWEGGGTGQEESIGRAAPWVGLPRAEVESANLCPQVSWP